ncbi:hypothetical protein ACWGB8_37395 [Kitasatospora sp. NPDC054939]
MAHQPGPFSALTDHAGFHEPDSDLDRFLPPFAAGRALSVLAYRDAAEGGDRPFDRRSPEATGTVLMLLPAASDDQDRGSAAPWWTEPATMPWPVSTASRLMGGAWRRMR